MERRTVLKVLTALPLRAADQCGTSSDLTGYRFAFFTAEEQVLLETLMELIIPADDHSPGAKAARVPAFADLMISTGSEQAKSFWRNGLAAFAGQPLETALARAAAEESRFFVELKRMTVDGYYTSTIGIQQEMGYIGNEHRTSAPSCDHAEHR